MMWRASCSQRRVFFSLSQWHSTGILTWYQLERDLSRPSRSNAPSYRIWARDWHVPTSIMRRPQHTCELVSWLWKSHGTIFQSSCPNNFFCPICLLIYLSIYLCIHSMYPCIITGVPFSPLDCNTWTSQACTAPQCPPGLRSICST